MTLTEPQQKELLILARQAIAKGCLQSLPHSPGYTHQPDIFHQQAACFVTLHKHGQLRGCIGSIEAHRPLLDDVLHNAFACAFRDNRFAPVAASELPELHLEISVLTPQQNMNAASEKDLLKKLRVGVDGLVIRDGFHSATFLPQVWEQLPEPEQFLRHLKQKAGLPADYWSENMECFCYQCIKFEE